jgi:alanine racemase
MAVVKANAYGHGMVEGARALLEAGADYLGVSMLEEGIELREAGIESPTLVFSPPFPNQAESILYYNLDATVCLRETAEVLNALGSSVGRKATVHVKVDTGMGRLGVDFREAVEFVKFVSSLSNLSLKGIYTHLATADERDKSFAHVQLVRFHDVVGTLSNSGTQIPIRHVANSGAILDLKDSHYDMVRPGIMLYGYYPSHETSESLSLRRVMSLRSRIDYLKMVEAGTPISYGRRYVTTRTTTIATVPIGYADGLSRSLTNKAEAIVGGQRYPVVGTICMDYVMLDLGTGSGAKVGDDVTFIGQDGDEEITAWEIADKLGTIPYEVCCAISDRVPRIYS